MDGSFWIWIVVAGTTSAALGALACFVVLKRSHALLQDRLVRTEQARNGAVERSAQAREQIAQLNRAIDELRRAHSMRPAASAPVARTNEEQRAERRERAEKALREAGAEAASLAAARQSVPLAGFADTQVADHTA
jgi:TolA-binding protein